LASLGWKKKTKRLTSAANLLLCKHNKGTEIMMSEDQIEFIVEKTMDKLDRELADNKLDLIEYDLEVSKLTTWAERQYQVAA